MIEGLRTTQWPNSQIYCLFSLNWKSFLEVQREVNNITGTSLFLDNSVYFCVLWFSAHFTDHK